MKYKYRNFSKSSAICPFFQQWLYFSFNLNGRENSMSQSRFVYSFRHIQNNNNKNCSIRRPCPNMIFLPHFSSLKTRYYYSSFFTEFLIYEKDCDASAVVTYQRTTRSLTVLVARSIISEVVLACFYFGERPSSFLAPSIIVRARATVG